MLLKNNLKLVFALLFLISLGFNGYFLFNNKTKTITVKIPEVSGELPEQKPTYIYETDTIYKTKWKTKTDIVEITTDNPVNDSLAQAYLKTKDSLEKAGMFLNSIQIRSFANTFEDENVKIDISGKVQGELLSIKPNYKIKGREQEVEVYNRRLINFGLQVGYGMTLHGASPYVGIGGQIDFEEAINRLLKH